MRKLFFTNLVWILLLGLLLPGHLNAQVTLKHAYPFEDGTADDTVGTLNGNLVGDSISIADGKCTVSGATNNTHGYMTLDAAALALNTYDAITLEAYVEAADGANGSYTMLAYFGNNTGGDKCFWIQPTRGGSTQSRVETNNGDATKSAYLNGMEIDDGKLHHVVAVLSDNALKYYLDGLLVAETAINAEFIDSLDTQIANIFKGPDEWADPNYNASLEELNIYDGELSADTISSRASAYVGSTDSRLASITPSPGSMLTDFSPYTTSYYVARDAGETSVNLDATPYHAGANVSGDGDIAITGTVDTVDIQVVSEDESDTTIYAVYIKEANNTDCYTPVYNPEAITNIIPDAECTDLDLWGGWGSRSILVNSDSAYCGLSSALIEAPGAGCEAALDIAGVEWKANTTYRLHVMVKTIGGSIGFLTASTDPDFGFAVDTEGEWMLVDTMFTTGAGAGTDFVSFNTCDFGSTCTAAMIDNYQLYEVSSNATLDDITVSEGSFNKSFSPSDTTYTLIVPDDADTIMLNPVPTIDSAYVVDVDTVIMQDGEGVSEILVTSVDSSATKTYTVNVVYESVFTPLAGQEYNIIQKISDLVLADADGAAQVVNKWETSTAQRIEIVESDVAGEYFILANNKSSFLYRSTENTWSVGFTDDTTGLTANCRWTFEMGNADTIYIKNPSTGNYLASDDVTDGSGVYHDKDMSNPNGVWNIVAIPETFIPVDTVYSLVQKASGLALGSDGEGGANVMTKDKDDFGQRLKFVESDEAGIFYIVSDKSTNFMYRLTSNTWSMGFTDDTTGLSANCEWKIELGNADTVYIQNPSTGNYVASDDVTDGSGVFHDKAMSNPNAVFTLEILGPAALSSDATLSDLQVDGATIDGFDASTMSYDVELPAGTSTVPPVTATATHSNANVEITDATEIPGSTTILVTAEDGSTTETYTINFTQATGIEDISIANIKVYPVPAQEILYIENAGNTNITIYNTIGGEPVKIQNITQNVSSINIEGLDPGMYLIKFENTGYVKRFIKK